MLGAAANDAAVVGLAAAIANDEVGVAEDGGERRAQIVADAGEKVALGAVGLFGVNEGVLQGARTALDGGLEPCVLLLLGLQAGVLPTQCVLVLGDGAADDTKHRGATQARGIHHRQGYVGDLAGREDAEHDEHARQDGPPQPAQGDDEQPEVRMAPAPGRHE